MSGSELPFVFDCDGARLIGIVHAAVSPAKRGVLIVVGGPQYRVGSHRQFLLLARYLADQGVHVMRFDYRGMGDSDGDSANFEAAAPDIRAAIDAFAIQGVDEVVLWGLCDAASAALMYAPTDPRVTGLILLNPWLWTEAGEGRAYLRHYYARRLFDASVWKQILSGGLELRKSLRSIMHEARKAFVRGSEQSASRDAPASYTERMRAGLQAFSGQVLFILSGNDLTAAQFRDATRASRKWRELLRQSGVDTRTVQDADHTFSKQAWREEVERMTLQWLRSW